MATPSHSTSDLLDQLSKACVICCNDTLDKKGKKKYIWDEEVFNFLPKIYGFNLVEFGRWLRKNDAVKLYVCRQCYQKIQSLQATKNKLQKIKFDLTRSEHEATKNLFQIYNRNDFDMEDFSTRTRHNDTSYGSLTPELCRSPPRKQVRVQLFNDSEESVTMVNSKNSITEEAPSSFTRKKSKQTIKVINLF